MFDIYVYDADNGECIGTDPCYPENKYKAVAMSWHSRGFAVKVVDQFDGCVVYTLG